MAAIALEAKARLDIGKVISQTFEVYRRNLMPVLAGSVLMVGLPQLVLGLLQINQVVGVGGAAAGANAGVGLAAGLAAIVVGLISVLFQAGLNRFTFDALNGQGSDLAGDIRKSVGVVLPLIGLGILFGLGVGLAAVLLLVPGIMLATAWSVAVPVVVIEDVSPIKAVGRSLFLTRGSRWSIFLLGLIAYAIFFLILGVEFALTGGFIAGARNPVRLFLLQPVVAMLISPLVPIGLSTLYHQLRASREGMGADKTAAVFD